MRFGIAVTVLASSQQILPTSSSSSISSLIFDDVTSSSSVVNTLLSSSTSAQRSGRRNGNAKRRRLQQIKDRMINGDETTKTRKKRSKVGNSPLLNNRRNTRNKRRVEQSTNKECDPNALDMGILECESIGNYYCVESQLSSTGGICSSTNGLMIGHKQKQQLNRRKLQRCSPTDEPSSCPDGSFCDLQTVATAGFCVDCPCGNNAEHSCPILLPDTDDNHSPESLQDCFDQCTSLVDPYPCQEYITAYQYCYAGDTTQLGAPYYSYYCFGQSPYCYYADATCCFAYGYAAQYGPPEPSQDYYFQRTYYYYFYQPYEQKIRFTYSSRGGTDCDLLFNDETCNLCEFTSSFEEFCFDFDCTNLPGGMAGNTCDGGDGSNDGITTLLPILNQCGGDETMTSSPSTSPPTVAPAGNGCRICGIDGYLRNPDLIVGGYTCEVTSNSTYSLFENGSPECITAQDSIGPACCDAIDPCNICTNHGGILMNPDAPLTNGTNAATCSDLYVYALQGMLANPDQCAYYSSIAGPTCCGDDFDPTCLVCPDDGQVSNPDTTVEFPGFPEVTCGQVQEFGRQGLIPPDLCEEAQAEIPTTCGCDAGVLPPSDMPGGETDPPATDPPGSNEVPSGSPGIPDPPTEDPVETEPPVAPTTEPPAPEPTDPPVDDTDPPDVQPTEEPTTSSSPYVNEVVAMVGASLALAVYMIT